jgi:hypothetical protein
MCSMSCVLVPSFVCTAHTGGTRKAVPSGSYSFGLAALCRAALASKSVIPWPHATAVTSSSNAVDLATVATVLSDVMLPPLVNGRI